MINRLDAIRSKPTQIAWDILAANPRQLYLVDIQGNNALHLAVGINNPALVKLLLEKDLDVDAENLSCITPLFIAASKGYLDIVELLLDYGANPDIANENYATPLFMAARNGHKDIVANLMRAGANPYISNVYNVSPIDIARSKHHTAIVLIIRKLSSLYYQCSDENKDNIFYLKDYQTTDSGDKVA